MGGLEIVLLAAGAVIFIASFCVPVKQEKLNEEAAKLAESEIKELVNRELDFVRVRLGELSEEEMQEQIEKSERSMERISNEKIMAVNEYSDTVLEEIHKNHEEVVFLYDMLKDKKEKLTDAFGSADKNVKELLQQVTDSEVTVKEVLKQIEEKQGELTDTYNSIIERQRELAENQKKLTEDQEEIDKKQKEFKTYVTEVSDKQALISAKMQRQEAKMVSAPAFKPFEPKKAEAVPKRAEAASGKAEAAPKKAEAASKKAGEKSGKIEAAPPSVSSVSRGKAGMNSNDRILELHKAGKSNMAIAKELGLGIGEVKLVIDLYESWR